MCLRPVGVRAARSAARGMRVAKRLANENPVAADESQIPRRRHRRFGLCASRTRNFLRGQGCYVADISLPGELHCVLRALAACACPRSAASTPRRRPPRPASSPCSPAPTWRPTRSARWRRSGPSVSSDGKPMAEPPRWALARDTVRHVGEPVAAVIAETRAQAQDAADLVDVDYEPLPAVVDGRAAHARRCAATARLPRPAMSASALRAATRPRCGGIRRRGPCGRGSISPTTG